MQKLKYYFNSTLFSISSFLSNGGDGWTFPNYTLSKKSANLTVESLTNYVKLNSPINIHTDGRIKIVYELNPEKQSSVLIFGLTMICILCIMVCITITNLICCNTDGSKQKVDTANSSIVYHTLK